MFDEGFDTWDDPLASDGPCPWGGLGNYVLLDSGCDWECPYRASCMTIQKHAKSKAQGKIWRKLFQMKEND